MTREHIVEVLWESPNKRWLIAWCRNSMGHNRLSVFRGDVTVEVTPFDVYIPKYVDAAYSRVMGRYDALVER